MTSPRRLFLGLLLAAASAGRAHAQAVCGVDYYGPCLPQTGSVLPDRLQELRERAARRETEQARPSRDVNPFSANAMDVMSMGANDPLTQASIREESTAAVRGDDPRASRRLSSEDGARLAPRRVATLARRDGAPSRDRRDAEALANLRGGVDWVRPGSAEDARGLHDGDSTSVLVSARARDLLGTSPSPSVYSRLGRMAEGLKRETAPARDAEALRYAAERWWEPSGPRRANPEAPVPADDGTRFFNLGK